jgi:hypothetical protein
VKPLVRSTVDTCVLPGIITGTEICWLYVMQWKKECYMITIAGLALVFYHFDLPAGFASYTSQSVVENENITRNQN